MGKVCLCELLEGTFRVSPLTGNLDSTFRFRRFTRYFEPYTPVQLCEARDFGRKLGERIPTLSGIKNEGPKIRIVAL